LHEGAALLDQAVRIDPNFAEGLINRGSARIALGEPEKAIEDVERCPYHLRHPGVLVMEAAKERDCDDGSCAYHLSHPDIFVMEPAEEWDCCE
jgi:hypothetical protein